MINFRKKLISAVLILIILLRLSYPVVVLADVAVVDTPTPTPTAEITPTPDPAVTIDASSDATVTNNNNSTADSGNNIGLTNCLTPSPTPDISIDGALPSPTPTPTETLCPSPTPDPSATTIDTGNATSITNVQNDVGVNSINSIINNDTQSVLGTQNSDVSLGSNNVSPNVSSAPIGIGQPEIGLNTIDNSATLTNTVVSIASTGGNLASGSAIIVTGDAYSVVSVVNNVSLTLVNSALQILSLNIFGTLNGNVVLPDANATACDLCNSNTNQEINNNAVITNNINSQAISGQNSITDTAAATISSGQSMSIVNLINLVNSLFIGSNVKGIFVNVFGQWNGNFVGWGDISSATGGSNLILLNSALSDPAFSCNCTSSSDITNKTVVDNNVTSIANTGKNNASGGTDNSIKTGNAYSEVSILNLINTTFVNSSGVFAFINIFGKLNGDIGGFSKFQVNESAPEQAKPSDVDNKDQGGGYLSMTQFNNVGEYVLPGDTVTFNIKIKNPGSGIVRNAKVHLDLVRDGKIVGGANFNIGDISEGRGKTLTTGLVLSKGAHAGQYTADAVVEGTSGDNAVSAEAISGFLVYSPSSFVNGIQEKKDNPKVLSASTSVKDDTNYPTGASIDIKTLLFLALLYLIVRILRNYKEIVRISQSKSVLTFFEFAQRMLM